MSGDRSRDGDEHEPGSARSSPPQSAERASHLELTSRDIAAATIGGSPRAAVQLQRSVGNRAFTRLLQRRVIDPGGSANPLVGLEFGDGMTVDTLDARPQVVLLQQELNRHMIANLKFDGMFGPKTSRALGDFQASIRTAVVQPVDQVTANALLFDVDPSGSPAPDPATITNLLLAAGLLQAAAFNATRSGLAYTDAGVSAVVASVDLSVALLDAGTQMATVATDLSLAALHLQRLVSGASAVGNPLVGLRRGDGLTFGTLDHRDRVKLLQGSLSEHPGTGKPLKVDGMFGPLTAGSLAAFQATNGLAGTEPIDADTADALLDRTPVPLVTVNCAAAAGAFGAASEAELQLSSSLGQAAGDLASTTAAGATRGLFAAAGAESDQAEALAAVAQPLVALGLISSARSTEALLVSAGLIAAAATFADVAVSLRAASTALTLLDPNAPDPNAPDPNAPDPNLALFFNQQAAGDLITASLQYDAIANDFAAAAGAFA